MINPTDPYLNGFELRPPQAGSGMTTLANRCEFFPEVDRHAHAYVQMLALSGTSSIHSIQVTVMVFSI